jgi:hypothetical protein
MIIHRWFPRRRRPARGQLSFWFIESPVPIYWTPPEPSRRSRPRSRPVIPPFRPRRARSDPGPFQSRVERQIERWVRRGAACLLCSSWPAPCDRWVGKWLIVLCRSCNALADAQARIEEIVKVDWAETAPGSD